MNARSSWRQKALDRQRRAAIPRRQCQQGRNTTEMSAAAASSRASGALGLPCARQCRLACRGGALERDNAEHPLGMVHTLLGISHLLVAHRDYGPYLCDVGCMLCFLGTTVAVEGGDILHHMLCKLREPLVQTLQVGFDPCSPPPAH